MTIEQVVALIGTAGGIILTSGVVAAVVTFFQNRWLEKRRSQEAERTRLRQSFAEAFAAYAEYKEFPYGIRRRREDQPAEERARLSAELTVIQSKLSYFRTWTQFESVAVGTAYERLLTEMRKAAGSAMRLAWEQPPSRTDAEMNIPIEMVDLRSLKVEEDKFIATVTNRLDALTPRHLRRR